MVSKAEQMVTKLKAQSPEVFAEGLMYCALHVPKFFTGMNENVNQDEFNEFMDRVLAGYMMEKLVD
jgi:hypothetical protein